ncbi:hypothetical protein [Roseicella sp. DB1501]|uniref:hypothetical protein n=1 Tax=Roseicella sp. DB1501 TaxID=2730925 RepID=UPI001491AEC0|nr:hypothetical protein [Roseicella sp. DB1501]NOG70456.1 hypothetical protein [Roseicella sp. DB1501]
MSGVHQQWAEEHAAGKTCVRIAAECKVSRLEVVAAVRRRKMAEQLLAERARRKAERIPTFEQARAAAVPFHARKGNVGLINLLAIFGATKLSEVPPEKRRQFIYLCQQ